MAALAITTGNVMPTSVTGIANVTVVGTAGTVIVAGKAVYVDASNKVQLADANVSSTEAQARGIALVNAQPSQMVVYQKAGAVAVGTTVASTGVFYFVGAAAPGDINPAADLTSSWFSTFLAYAYTNTILIIPTQGPVITDVKLI